MGWDSEPFPEKAKLFCQSWTASSSKKTAHTCLCTLRRRRQTNCIYTTLTHRRSCSVITEKDPAKQGHDHQWSERKALHQLPHRNCRTLPTLNALCAHTNAALQLQKDPYKTLEHTTLKTFLTPHHLLHTSYFSAIIHTARKKVSSRATGIYSIATDTPPHSLLSLQSWVATGRTVLLWTIPTEPYHSGQWFSSSFTSEGRQ